MRNFLFWLLFRFNIVWHLPFRRSYKTFVQNRFGALKNDDEIEIICILVFSCIAFLQILPWGIICWLSLLVDAVKFCCLVFRFTPIQKQVILDGKERKYFKLERWSFLGILNTCNDSPPHNFNAGGIVLCYT